VAILGYADVLLEELARETGPHQAASRIRRQGEHLLTLIDDLIDLALLERGELRVQPEEGNLREVVKEVCGSFAAPAGARGLDLVFEARRDLPVRSRFDPLRVRQVVRHLLDNAVKFTPRGSVRVRLRTDPGPVAVVSVTDTGPGLSPERFEALCAPLQQGDDGLSRGQRGCGIGLALARGLAREQGGDLSCLGGPAGTTVRFRLPVQPASGHEAAAAPTAHGLRGRALVVEDGPDNQVLIRRILERIGLEVQVAADGEAGVEAALGGEFDLVLMDIQMPRLDGLSATRQLRAHGFDVPIVALTANTGHGWRERCLEAGCDDYLTKPVDRMVLVERVARLLDRKRDPQNSV
jgi:CheY-like chemotaxis protein